MSTRNRTRQRRQSARPSVGRGAADDLAAVRALVESFARDIHLPRGVPSARGQPGHASWRAARERLLYHQLDMLAEEAREEACREVAPSQRSPRPVPG
jgi:hypothetical protein